MLSNDDRVYNKSDALNENYLKTKKLKKDISVATYYVETGTVDSEENKERHYQIYQPWVLKTYGDLAKTKTITLKKQARIIYALKGLESKKPDSSKFKFWVKSKGFTVELPPELKSLSKYQNSINDGCLLYVPSKSDTHNISFKKVAVVEYFFNIIFKNHCPIDAEDRRHIGQKRTYRKIQECYSFLPREAVTKFLSQCIECRRASRTNTIQNITEKVQNISDHHVLDIKNQPLEPFSFKNNCFKLQLDNEKSLKFEDHVRISEKVPEAFKENIFNSQTFCFNSNNSNGFSSKIQNTLKNVETYSSYVVVNSNSVDQFKDVELNQISKELDTNSSICSKEIKSEENNETKTDNSIIEIFDNQQRKITNDQTNKQQQANNSQTKYDLTSTDYDPHKIDRIANDCSTDFHYNIKQHDDDYENNCNSGKSRNHQNISDTTKFHPNNIKSITSSYLLLTRSMGLSDEDALNLDSISTPSQNEEQENLEDSYNNFSMKDADKLRLMLLAWNYQNSSAIRNGNSGPDMTTMSNLWEQYQNALALNKSGSEQDLSSPTQNQEDSANSPSETKEEDELSEDESDDRIDQVAKDPERLKAFNMFVRLFVDENLDRMVPISKQPKEKVQAIIDSCSRQFPEFSERARKRLRTYLKSCRRNKKTKDGWENQPSRPTPAHLTSVQAEQILAVACENENLNAKRMRIGLEPIAQSITIPSTHFNDLMNSSLYTTTNSIEPVPATQTFATSVSNSANNQINSNNVNSINSIMSSTSPTSSNSNVDFGSGFSAKNSTGQVSKTSNFCVPALPSTAQTQGTPIIGPTDLSVKRPLLPHKLNISEAAAVKQLITGYRESAAFLLRSADELEQLLQNQ